jgi:ABC-2 type transport system permease protein
VSGHASGFMLMRPRWLALAGRWRRADPAERRRAVVLTGLALVFWSAIFVFFARVLSYFQAVPELGPVLAERLLSMVLLSFFSILLFSNIITALSTYYLSSDLALLLASPIAPRRLHAARFIETLWDSSWMIVLFGLPIFLAYGVVHHTGPAFYAAVLAVLPPFLMLPCALGVAVTMSLVRVFPARNTKDVFVLLSVVAIALVYVFLRFLQPEQLVRPEAFADFLQFLAAVQAPSSPFLPSSWAAGALIPYFAPRPNQDPVLQYFALLSSAAAAYVACSMIAERIYTNGWSRSQEGRRARVTRLPLWDRAFAYLPMSAPVRALVTKDVKTFARDTTQWSQLVLLGALVVVYIYNFRVLPRAGALMARFYLEHALGFLNLALAAFVTASVAVRFLYPAISLEGKAFWLLQSAPLRLRRVWWSKFWSGVAPLATLGTLLLVLGNRALEVGGVTMAVSVATLLLMTLGIAALGLCLGSLYPQFEYENAAKIPSSFGGVVYMILAILFIGLNVVLEAWPLWVMLFTRLVGRPLTAAEIAGVIASFSAVVAVDLAVFGIAATRGVRALESLRG